jgi:hypothetical protein
MKDLKSKAQELAQYGRNGDTMLAHITPQEAGLLKAMGGSGTINPKTGLPEFFFDAVLGFLGASEQADAQRDAAAAQAQATTEAARIAAEEARFRPVAITTGFGKSSFETDEEGRLKAAGYELTPEMQALRNQLIAQTGQQGLGFTQQGLQAAQGLFGLGQQYLAQTPEQAAQQWMASQQAALAPGREQAMSGLMNRLAQTGTQGLGVAQAGGGAANPLMQAFANAQAQQDRELAAQAMQQGRAQTQFGTGLFGDAFKVATGGYSPMAQQLAQAQGIEALGQTSLDLGAQLGGRAANATGANALLQGGVAAANALAQANSVSPMGDFLSGLSRNQQFTSGANNWLSGMMNPSGYSNPWSGASLSQWSSPAGVTAGSQQDQLLRAQMFG